MIALGQLPSESDCRLARCIPRREGGGSIVWDLDVAFEMEDDGDAEVVEEFVPGTVAAWAAGSKEGGKGQVKASGNFDIVRVTFELDGSRLATGHAEIRSCAVTVNQSCSVLLVKMRLHGMMPTAAVSLVYAMDELVTVKAESRQMKLFDAGDPDESTPKESLAGKLVSTGGVSGIVVGESDSHLEIDTLQEVATVERPAHVDSLLDVVGPNGGPLESALDLYKDSADSLGIPMLWEDIIEAIGRMYAEGDLTSGPGLAWEVTEDVVKRALLIGKDRDYEAQKHE